MKKLLIMGVLALGTIALTQQEASAWINSRFGVGLNWHFQSGGNNLAWGLWRNSQPPGPEYGSTFPGPGGGHGHAPGYYAPPPAPYFGGAPTPEPALASPVSQQWNYQQPRYQTVTFPGAYNTPQYYYPASYYYYGR